MRLRILKIVGATLGVLVIAVGGLVAFLELRSPKSRPASSEKIAATPERLARGKYLVENVSACIDCHSERDASQFAGPVKADLVGGGTCFPDGIGLPGKICPPNITPSKFGVGEWTDGELMRAIREGISRDGHALFPMMPYPALKQMSDEDLRSVVVYLRTLKPVDRQLPRTDLAFPLNLLIKGAPQPVEGVVEAPPKTDRLAYGKYLIALAGCHDCHTQQERGQPVEGMDFAGGWDMKLGRMHVVTANITPDQETGIGKMTREEFIGRFRSFAELGDVKVEPERQTTMPWRLYGKMTEEDLGLIYDYLRTVKPVRNKIVTFPDSKI